MLSLWKWLLKSVVFTVLSQTSYHEEYVKIICLLQSIISHRNFFLKLTEINQTPEPPIQLHSQGYTKMLFSFSIYLYIFRFPLYEANCSNKNFFNMNFSVKSKRK